MNLDRLKRNWRNEVNKKKAKFHLFYILVPLIIIVIIFCVYFSIRYALTANSNPNLVSMISGWISAVATAALGGFSLWQNKQYKKLSDKSSVMATDLQQEIRNLTVKSQQALTTLKKIENIKYQPMLKKWNVNYFGFSKESFTKCIKEYSCAVQQNLFNVNFNKFSE